MRQSLRFRIVIIAVLTTVLLPQKSFAERFELYSWKPSQSFYAAKVMSTESIGIGGLQVQIDSKLDLKPSDLSYSESYLRANTKEKQLAVKVEPKIILDSMRVVEQANKIGKKVFKVSIDTTAVGRNKYTDEILEGEGEGEGVQIGESLLSADKSFAKLVWGRIPLPEGAPQHPYSEALKLLKTDSEYKKLPVQWKEPPRSAPQIYLSFDPNAPGLVDAKFNPQVFFFSPYGGVPLSVDKKLQSLAERPYQPLIKDIKARPLAYRDREVLPFLDRAATITATLGLIAAGCRQAESCTELKRQVENSSDQTSLSQTPQKESSFRPLIPPDKDRSIKAWEEQYIKEDRFIKAWEELSFQTFQPSDAPKAWAIAYDTVQEAVREYHSQAPKQEVKDLVVSQFIDRKVPENSLLQAASAVALVWNGEFDAARKALYHALDLSKNYPGDRFEVAEIGKYVITSIHWSLEEKSDSSLKDDLKHFEKIHLEHLETVRVSAQLAAFDEVDQYLTGCEQKPKTCSSEDLRTWEADAARAGLFESIPNRDVSSLHGRFAYLIGIQIKDPEQQSNRLRYLSFYAQNAEEDNRSHLEKLLADFQARLGGENPSSFNWRVVITVIAIVGVILIGWRFIRTYRNS